MRTNNLTSIVRMGILIISCTALLASCTTEPEEVVEPLYTLGDPKNSSPQGSRSFEISSFVLAGEEQASAFEEIKVTFQNNGTVIANSPNQQWPGSWNVGFVDGVQKLFLNFPDAPPLINTLSGIWTVVSLDTDHPQFINDEGDVLEFLPTGETIMSLELQAFNTSLLDSLWGVQELVFQDNDVTGTFNDVIFDFKPNGTVIAQRFGQQRIGQWVTGEDEDGISLTFQFNPPPAALAALNREWHLVSSGESQFDLENLEGSPGNPGSLGYLIITMEN
ncbi:MAG: hypothetical protein WBG42_15590 [Cryomorphaceae bacterium]